MAGKKVKTVTELAMEQATKDAKASSEKPSPKSVPAKD